MKRSVIVSVCIGLLMAAWASSPAWAGDKPRIAVLEFENKADNQYWWHGGAAAIQDVLVTELVKGGKFSVIERERISAILQEKGLVLSGDISPSTAMQIGKLLGAEYMVAGSVTEYGETDVGGHAPGVRGLPSFGGSKRTFVAAANARIFSVSTGEILWADEARDQTSSFRIRVGGFGGGKDDRRMFDKVMKPVVQQLAASINAADL